jgi:hypothetical protein
MMISMMEEVKKGLKLSREKYKKVPRIVKNWGKYVKF